MTPVPHGPFEAEPRVSKRDPDRSGRRQLLLQVLDGVELGAWDEVILDGLAMWEPSTLIPVVGWIWRARAAGSQHGPVTKPGPRGHA